MWKVGCLKVASRGNRFVSKWAMSDFLSVSFGHDIAKGRRIMSRNSQALAMQMAPSTVATMRAVTAGSNHGPSIPFVGTHLDDVQG